MSISLLITPRTLCQGHEKDTGLGQKKTKAGTDKLVILLMTERSPSQFSIKQDSPAGMSRKRKSVNQRKFNFKKLPTVGLTIRAIISTNGPLI